MPATYEPIATTTVSGTSTTQISFSSFSGYTDLRLVMVGTVNGASNAYIQFNSDTGTNYSATNLNGNGTSASSDRITSSASGITTYWGFSNTPPHLWTVDIFGYAGSTNKTSLGSESADENGSGSVTRSVFLWRSTSAITSIQIKLISATYFLSGFTATLYGIKAA